MSLFATPCAADTFLDGIRPAVPASYLELRERDGANSFRVVATSGNECLLAGDQDQCSGDFDALPTWPGFHACVGHDCGHSLAVTRAKPMGLYQVESYTDSKKLLAFLGPLDTPADAVLYTYAQGYDFNCTDSDPTLTGGVREAIDGDGFEVLTSLVSHACEPLLVTGYHYHVTTRGDLIMLNSWQVTNDPTVRCN